jgi:hypothetical protein
MTSASTSTYAGRKTSLVTIGAYLGVAANSIGWLLFVLMCFGFGAAVNLAILPLGLAVVGMILTVYGAVVHAHAGDVDTHVLASLFVNLFGIVGGLSLVAVWLRWTILQ